MVRVRDPKQDGYRAVQVGFGTIKESHMTKPLQGQFKQAGTEAFRHLREFRLPTTAEEWKVGQQLTVDVFKQHELVDVTGISIGKGFQGGMKRWHWRGGAKTHGSTSHRRPGSIGSTTTPGRVWRGHHLPGHMGADRVTVQNLRIVRLDPEHHLLVLQGAVPGAEQQLIMITKSKKHPGFIKKPQEFQAIIEDDENLSKTAKAASKKPKTQQQKA